MLLEIVTICWLVLSPQGVTECRCVEFPVSVERPQRVIQPTQERYRDE